MAIIRKLLLLFGIAAALAVSGPALAQGHFHGGPRVHFGFVFGGPLYYPPPYYYYPPAYYPPAVIVPPAPQTYIERGDAADSNSAQNDWYYCAESKAYYPYVKQCPGGWQRVAPSPPR
jgi:hypothetical protein